MAMIGYARESAGHSLATQMAALEAAGCERVFVDKPPARDRPELERALAFVREGDVLVVRRLDRLAQSVSDLDRIIGDLRARGVDFRATERDVFDTTAASGPLFLSVLSGLAQFELGLRTERQREGIERAKAAGRYRGRPASVDRDLIRRLHADGLKPATIRDRLKVSLSTVYEAIKEPPKTS
jgi:DNA invertase Pin-like site-specific DNA recombinase